MRKRLMLSVIPILILVLFASVRSYGWQHNIVDNYYSNATFTSAVGWWELDCDGVVSSDGPTTDWRFHENMNCNGSSYTAECQQWNGNMWVEVECPDIEAVMDGRLRVPVG